MANSATATKASFTKFSMESAIDLVSKIFGTSLKYRWEMYIGAFFL